MVQDFSDGEDLDNLPNDYKLKDYMYCCALQVGIMKEGSLNFHLEEVLEFINQLDPYYQDIYFGFNRRCSNKLKEPREKLYAVNVCHKKNDIVVSTAVYNSLCDKI